MRTPVPDASGHAPVGCFWIGIVLFAMGAPLSFRVARNAIEEWRIAHYVPVPCTIASSRLDLVQTTHSVRVAGNKDEQQTAFIYTPRVTYSYAVPSGGVIRASRFGSRNLLESLSATTARAYVDAFKPGARTTCFRDPADPEKSVAVNVHGDRRRYLIFLPMIALALAGALAVVATLKERSVREIAGPVA